MNSLITFTLQKLKHHFSLHLIMILLFASISDYFYDLTVYKHSLSQWNLFPIINQSLEFLNINIFSIVTILSALTSLSMMLFCIAEKAEKHIWLNKHSDQLHSYFEAACYYCYCAIKLLVIVILAGYYLENGIIIEFWKPISLNNLTFTALIIYGAPVILAAILLLGEFSSTYLNPDREHPPSAAAS